MSRGPLIVITGPTASGKTALAVRMALALGGELVGADSVQVYRGFDIGSNKPGPEELRGIPHHLLDVVSADETIDAVHFASLADTAIDAVRARGKVPIVVGGSGLWLRALLRGLLELPAVDPELRARLQARARAQGAATLHAELKAVDPEAALAIHENDEMRIVRALEVYEQTGQPLGRLRAQHALGEPRYDALRIMLDPRADLLHARIARRTAAMVADGFVREVRALWTRWGDVRALASVGYRQIVPHVRGEQPLPEAIREVERATRVYARRQRTWLRGEPGHVWQADPFQVMCDEGLQRLRAHLGTP